MASTASSANHGSESYTSMSQGDVEAIGRHCQLSECHRLDFLPFRCESCRGTYCLDHRTETAHSCRKAGTWARGQIERTSTNYRPTEKPSLLNHDQQCSSPSCSTLINTALVPGVHCPTCNRQYCLKHRMAEEHACKTLTPLGARASVAQPKSQFARQALNKLKEFNKVAAKITLPKSSSSKQQTRENPIVTLNKLKQAAKGEASIPQDKRLYLYVEASADTTTAKFPTGKFFYNKEWSVGRVLDAAAKALQVENVNNRGGGEEERLRVFHVEAGRLLDFNEKLGTACQNGNTIVLLRGVGPPIPDLIEA
ncbi:hypothetical protein AOQ84DRAFT_11703 [Glonium stellatum]|uniref:AN1-type domain-containing protein n=1 Tax=Glonium stellatum TaxID=574774 RepID=A0A8E2JU95_9PEZI|nr:hypothetical protein AOQ84DRAFT_11703 [Glonium stellatum]